MPHFQYTIREAEAVGGSDHFLHWRSFLEPEVVSKRECCHEAAPFTPVLHILSPVRYGDGAQVWICPCL